MSEDSRPPVVSPENAVTRLAEAGHDSAVTVGPYRLLRILGSGGMGDVWLAEQTRPVRRQVALKIIKTGMDTAQVVARFEAERQALAIMDHPGIARVLDAGATPEGRPYFVMEYVRGEPLTTYCSKHKLPIRERLELFAQICDGVQHAHLKGIIHRDLKPSNVLIALQDDRPIPKIIDFGVAKATAQTLTDQPLHTEFGAMIGTPEYMSPEQAEMTGLDIDTRTDVYTLGVMLYELLTGTLPFESALVREKGLDEMRRTIREIDPPRPSTRVTTAVSTAHAQRSDASRLASQLRGDLDWITMRALEKDRTRRYQTANAFALDLRRHLSGEPVLAAPPSTMYRVRKFARRHRGGVAAASFLLFLLIAFSAAMVFQARRIAQERDRANREARTAKAISSFLQDDLLAQAGAGAQASAGAKPDPNLTVRTALDRAAARLPGQFRGEPEVQSSLSQTIGGTYLHLGLYPEAERHIEAAAETRRRTLGAEHPETLRTLATLGDLFRLQGKYEQAERVLKNVVAAGHRVLGEEHDVTQTAENNLGIVYRYLGRYKEAEPLYVKHLEVMRRLSGERHADTLTAMNNLASLYRLQAKFDDADGMSRRAIELATSALGKEHPITITLTNNLALSYLDQGRYADARPLYLTVFDFAGRVWGERHPNTLLTMTSLASVYRDQGNYADAEPLLNKALAVSRVVQGENNPNTLITKQQLVELYQAQGKSAASQALEAIVVSSRTQALGAEHPSTLYSMRKAGELLADEHKDAEAEAEFGKVAALQRRVNGKDHPETLATLTSLGRVLIDQHKYAAAETVLREAVDAYARTAFENWVRYVSEGFLGASLAGQGAFARAEPLLLSAYEGLTRLEDRIPAHERGAIAATGERLSQLYKAWGKPEKAAEWRSRVVNPRPGRIER